MAKLYNLAAMTVGSTGTGTITLGSAATVNGVLYLSFAGAGVANGETIAYSINDAAQSETGTGVYTSSGTTLTRVVRTSTNSNAAINMTSAAIVRISPSKEDLGNLSEANTWIGINTHTNSIISTPTASSTIQSWNSSQSGPTTGTVTGPLHYNEIDITNNVNVTGTDSRTAGLWMQFNTGGTNGRGGQYGAFFNMKHSSASTTGADMMPLVASFYSSASAGSTGEGYGGNIVAFADSGASWPSINGLEIDVGVSNLANVTRRSGLRIVADNTGINAAGLPIGEDGAIWLTSKDINGSFKLGINLSTFFGAAPLLTTGSVIGATGAQTITNFADLTNLTITGNIIKSTSYNVTGAGVVSATGLISSANTAALPAAGNLLHIGASNGNAAIGTIDSFGTGTFTAYSEIDFRRANGTAASPTAVQASDLIGLFGGIGYGTSAYSSVPRAQLRFTATENWTNTAQGEKIAFLTTPTGGTSTAVAFEILDSGLIGFQAGVVANGSVATAMSSLGPTGSHTTVQEWLTIKNSAGTTRYIALF